MPYLAKTEYFSFSGNKHYIYMPINYFDKSYTDALICLAIRK